jgi:hypothetical protein
MICCGLPLSDEGYVDGLLPAGGGRSPFPDNGSPRAGATSNPPRPGGLTLPTALVTGSPERVPDIAIALKSAGFDILAAGSITPEEAPDLGMNSVDCYVQLPADQPRPTGGALRRTRDVIASEMLSRFDVAARLLPLLAPSATVVLVTEGPDPAEPSTGRPDADQKTLRTLVGVLAEAILRDCGRTSVRTTVIGEDRAPEEIAALASHRPPELPWWLYASVDPDLDFADWRASILCLASLRNS